MTRHFCRQRAESFPPWGPWPKEPGDLVFLCACGFIGDDNHVHRSHGPTDCPECDDAMAAWRVEHNARRHHLMMQEAGPRWHVDPIVHNDGSITPRISCGPLSATRYGDRWIVDVSLSPGVVSARGGSLDDAVRSLRSVVRTELDAAMRRVNACRDALDTIAALSRAKETTP